MTEDHSFLFPAYTLLYLRSKTAYVVRIEDRLALPIFSDRDNAESYVRKSGITDAWLIEFESPNDLIEFVTNPPLLPGREKPGCVVVDPLDQVRRFNPMVFTCDQVIKGILEE